MIAPSRDCSERPSAAALTVMAGSIIVPANIAKRMFQFIMSPAKSPDTDSSQVGGASAIEMLHAHWGRSLLCNCADRCSNYIGLSAEHSIEFHLGSAFEAGSR
jgi:hypothetical protein